jgi:Uncharacterized conserved protein
MLRNFHYYMSLPYQIVIRPSLHGGVVAAIPELPGCISEGEDEAAALKLIRDAQAAWIAAALNKGGEIPEPVPGEDEFSGQFRLRIPKSLHRDLVRRADAEKVSLNTLATYLLSSGVGKSMAQK